LGWGGVLCPCFEDLGLQASLSLFVCLIHE
jgi:hypothetical protein